MLKSNILIIFDTIMINELVIAIVADYKVIDAVWIRNKNYDYA